MDELKVQSEQLRTIAKAVRDLADGLALSARNQRSMVADLQSAMVEIFTQLDTLKRERLTAEALAESCTREVLDLARKLHWERVRGEAPSLPPAPHDLVPSKRDDDASLTFGVDRQGDKVVTAKIKAAKILPWVTAAIAVLGHVVRLIADAVHGR